jgi:hypothetical protein
MGVCVLRVLQAFGGRPLTPSLLRSWVLGYTKELVFINKPFGLMVQVRRRGRRQI